MAAATLGEALLAGMYPSSILRTPGGCHSWGLTTALSFPTALDRVLFPICHLDSSPRLSAVSEGRINSFIQEFQLSTALGLQPTV